MNSELNETPSEEAAAPDARQSSDRDEVMAAAMRYIRNQTGWRVVDLASTSGLSIKTIRRIMTGRPTSTRKLNVLCYAIGLPPWLFWLIGSFQFKKDHPERAELLHRQFHVDPEAYGPIIDGVKRLLASLTQNWSILDES